MTRVRGSSTFARASKQRALLEWLVEQAVSGNSQAFSQYSIATQALGYPVDFDATSDSTVRTAMRRLRERLAQYYQTEGLANRFHIEIEDGQYQPKLVRRQPSMVLSADPPQSSGKLAVLVLPVLPIGFTDINCLCSAVTLNLMRALSASDEARVVPWATSHWLAAKTGDKREYHRATGADVILEGLVQQRPGGGLSVTVQWIDALTGLFDTFHEARGSETDLLALIDDLATSLAQRLKVTYDDRARLQLALCHSTDPVASAYFLKARESSFSTTPQCMERSFRLVREALKRDPQFASAHALLSNLHLAVSDAGVAQPHFHAPLSRQAAQQALALAPSLGDALAARGALELTYDWNLSVAAATLHSACQDPLAECAPMWSPLVDLARGQTAQAATRFEQWARLDPGSPGKAAMSCALFYHAQQFDRAVIWGFRALQLDPHDQRATAMLTASLGEAGRFTEAISLARRVYDAAPDSAAVTLTLVAALARAGQRPEASQIFRNWQDNNNGTYIFPLILAIAYAWLGETSRAIEAVHQLVQGRHTAALYARVAPYLSPLHGRADFDRVLSEAGIHQLDMNTICEPHQPA